MSLLDMERALVLNPANLEINGAKQLSQVPGTDGSGGGGSIDDKSEKIPVFGTFANGYVDISSAPLDTDSFRVYILSATGELSPEQNIVKDFTLVRDSVGGQFVRIVWDSNQVPGGTTIPDPSDLPPNQGMEDMMIVSDFLLIKYF